METKNNRVVILYINEEGRLSIVDRNVYDCEVARMEGEIIWITLITKDSGVSDAMRYDFDNMELLYFYNFGEEEINKMTPEKLVQVIDRTGKKHEKEITE